VASLPKDQAELLQMSFFDDKSHGVIAQDTGLPLGTVKSRLRLALTRLRAQLRNIQ
jgi:RNA polymerase sigma-70 factor (ECF subfamily)